MIKKILLLLPMVFLSSCISRSNEPLFTPLSSFTLDTPVEINEQVAINDLKLNFKVISYDDYLEAGPINTFYENARNESGLIDLNFDKYYYQVNVDLVINETSMNETIFIMQSYRAKNNIFQFSATIKFSSINLYGNFSARYVVNGRDYVEVELPSFSCIYQGAIVSLEKATDFVLRSL